MSTDYSGKINQLKENLDKAKNLRIRAEAKMEQLSKQKEDIINEIQELGVKPEEIGNEITRLKAEIEELIDKAQKMLPAELINRNI